MEPLYLESIRHAIDELDARRARAREMMPMLRVLSNALLMRCASHDPNAIVRCLQMVRHVAQRDGDEECHRELLAMLAAWSSHLPLAVLAPLFDMPPPSTAARDAVRELYARPQCSQCGWRWCATDKEKTFASHLDWHYQQNRTRNSKKRVNVSRSWFATLSEWQSAGDPIAADMPKGVKRERAPPTPQHAMNVLVADSAHSSCAMCGEKFLNRFDHAMDEWVYDDVLRRVHDGSIVHVECNNGA